MPRPAADEHTGRRTSRLDVKASPEEHAHWAQAAAAEGRYLADWVREVLTKEAWKALTKNQQKKSK